ncbi:MAG: hypothetical protein IPL42_09620 [Saprospiraceae bacterium]|nr:hypothetical protein [Saprospiraceae bacterium]
MLSLWPDLQSDSVLLTIDTAIAGEVIPLTYKVSNKGIGPTKQSQWTDKLYISQLPVLDTINAVFLLSFTHNGILQKDSSYYVNTSVQIPGSLTGGKYYVHLYCDAGKNVYEYSFENNNILKGDSIYIKPYPPIDLALTEIVAPDSASSGNTINILWTTKKYNASWDFTGQWTDALYLSKDTHLDNGDILVSEVKP